MIGIYKVTNKANDKCYIGSTIDLAKREREHFRHLQLNIHPNQHLQNAYNIYGKENFTFEIILYCNKEHLLFFEQRAMNTYGMINIYNIRPKAESNIGVKHSVEANRQKSIRMKGHNVPIENRIKTSQLFKGKKLSLEHRKKLSESHKNPSDEIRKKISESSKGRIPSIDSRLKRRRSMLGRKATEETRRKLSEARKNMSDETKNKIRIANTGEKNPQFGKKASEETKRKLSAVHKGIPKSPECRKKISESNKGKKRSPESIKNMIEAKTMRFSSTQIDEMKKLRNNGMSFRNIGKTFRCSTTPIMRILSSC